jgi:hypothetical protein
MLMRKGTFLGLLSLCLVTLLFGSIILFCFPQYGRVYSLERVSQAKSVVIETALRIHLPASTRIERAALVCGKDCTLHVCIAGPKSDIEAIIKSLPYNTKVGSLEDPCTHSPALPWWNFASGDIGIVVKATTEYSGAILINGAIHRLYMYAENGPPGRFPADLYAIF